MLCACVSMCVRACACFFWDRACSGCTDVLLPAGVYLKMRACVILNVRTFPCVCVIGMTAVGVRNREGGGRGFFVVMY